MGRISSTLLRNGVIFIGGTAKTEKSVFRGAFSNVCGTFCGTEVPFASGTLKFDSCPRGGGEKVTNSSCLRDAKKCRPIRSGHFSGACTGCGRTFFFSFWDPAPGDSTVFVGNVGTPFSGSFQKNGDFCWCTLSSPGPCATRARFRGRLPLTR